MTVSPMSSREGSGQPAGRHFDAAPFGTGSGSSRLPATAAPTDRYESIAGSGMWPGSPSSQPVMPMSGHPVPL
jgi:hypothetical protein